MNLMVPEVEPQQRDLRGRWKANLDLELGLDSSKMKTEQAPPKPWQKKIIVGGRESHRRHRPNDETLVAFSVASLSQILASVICHNIVERKVLIFFYKMD